MKRKVPASKPRNDFARSPLLKKGGGHTSSRDYSRAAARRELRKELA